MVFNLGSAKVYSPAIIETCFSYDKDIWISSTDYYMYFYLIMLFKDIFCLFSFLLSLFSLLTLFGPLHN